jgi:hypothetical protein
MTNWYIIIQIFLLKPLIIKSYNLLAVHNFLNQIIYRPSFT